jgi:DNA-binding CsgD family transcriptional regulator
LRDIQQLRLSDAVLQNERFTVAKRSAKPTQALVVATRNCRVQFLDPVARHWLNKFFGRPARAGLLPPKIYHWLTRPGKKTADRFLLARKDNAQLYVRHQKTYTDRSTVLLLELIRGRAEAHAPRHHNLTPREREVLLWLARGKSNAEIGLILEIKPATVGKHLERIYPKLGVENRTAAASFAPESTNDQK